MRVIFDQIWVEKKFASFGKFHAQKKRVFDFMSDIWRREIIVDSIFIIIYLNIDVWFSFIFSLYELPLKNFWLKRLDKGIHFFLEDKLLISGWFSWIHENWRGNCGVEYLGGFLFIVLDVYDEYQVEFYSFIIIARWIKFNSSEKRLSVNLNLGL